jgi:hypothetical protein
VAEVPVRTLPAERKKVTRLQRIRIRQNAADLTHELRSKVPILALCGDERPIKIFFMMHLPHARQAKRLITC